MDALASSLKQKLSLIDKMIALQRTVREKRHTAVEEADTLRPILQLLVQKTKELQAQVITISFGEEFYYKTRATPIFSFQFQIEQDISKRYKNRVVRLTGGISAL